MIIDRRKNDYDELQILAGDVRTRRRRANLVTSGLIGIGVVGTAAYIAAMNEQTDGLREARDRAESQVAALRFELSDLRGQLYKDYADRFAAIATTAPVNLEYSPTIEVPRSSGESPADSRLFSVANFVWVVDGSRRFPMTNLDVLWIPEGQFWVRLQDPVEVGQPPRTISLHPGSRPAVGASDVHRLVVRDVGTPMEVRINRGNNSRATSNCISLQLHDTSSRPGLGDVYFDMEVIYSNPDSCGIDKPYRFEMTAGDMVGLQDLDPGGRSLWVQLLNPAAGGAQGTISVHDNPDPLSDPIATPQQTTGAYEIAPPGAGTEGRPATRICANLETGRVGQPANYVDLVITFTNDGDCS